MEASQIPPVQGSHEEDEFEKMLQSLPKMVFGGEAIYQYQNSWHVPIFVQAILSCQQHFQAHHTDVFLVTQPKSGTLWLKALTFAIVNRTRFTPTSSAHPFLTENPHELVPFLEAKLYLNNPTPDLSNLGSPRLFASHVSYTSLPESIKESNSRIVYLCRNPKDVFVSAWHFAPKIRPQETPLPIDEPFDNFCNGFIPFGPFWDHVLEYWNASLENSEKVLFLKYENMKKDTTSTVKKLAQFLGYPFSLEEEEKGIVEEIIRLCSFESLSNLDVNQFGKVPGLDVKNTVFFRKGKVGDWRNHLTPQMIEKIDGITQEKLTSAGLSL